MRALWAFCATLIIGVVVASTGAAAQSVSTSGVALVVGNSKYPDSDAPIPTPAEDARALGAELKTRGFDVEVAQDLSTRALREATNRLLAKVRPGSVVVVYFAGYGIQTSRQNFLVPVDAQIWTEMDLQRSGFSLERLLAELDRRGVGQSFVIVDAAHRNPFERRFRSFSTGLAPIKTPPPNLLVLFSAAPGAVLKQASGPRSVFSTELVKQIQAAGGLSQDVLARTRTAVASATQNDQTPWLFAARQSPPGDTVAGLSTTARRPPPPPLPAETRPNPRDPIVDVGAEYRKARQAGTKQAFEDFLAKHRTGSYADLARAEIARIDAAAVAEAAADLRRAQQTGTKQAFEDFLTKHKTGAHADFARSEIARLDASAKAEAAADFRRAQQAGTKQAFEDYLAKHKTGPEADLARSEIARLDSAAQADFRRAQQAGTKQAFEDYLAKHKTGPNADFARQEVARLEAAEKAEAAADFRKAQQAGTKQAFEDYLAKHRTGPQVELARAEIARLDEEAQAARRPGRRVLPYSSDDEMLLADLDRRIARDPNDSGALYTRGQIYAVHEDFERALADFDRVVKLNPGDVEALNNRCWTRAILDELDGALADCNEALKLRPNFLDALDSRGFVNLKIGLPRRALSDYDAALKVDASHVSAIYGRGLARLRAGDAAKGNSDVARALKLHPGVAEEFARLGVK